MPNNDANLIVGIELDQADINRAISVFGNQVSRSLSTGINAGLAGLHQWAPALGRITGKANEFQKSLEASNARVIAFGASAGIIFGLQSAFRKLVSSTVEVEKELTNINVLFQLGSADLTKFSKSLFDVANNTGSAFTDAAKAATEFSRQGLSVEETLRRTASALTLSRLSGLALEDSISSLTATMNSFVKESLTTEDVVNRLTAVDARYAVSAGDLALGLSRVSAAANDAGVSLNQTVALITAAQQITARGGSVLGNSFKTIFTRLQRPQVLDTLEQTGIAVRDANGKTKPMIEVLKVLSQSYEGLSSAQKSFVSETVGGVYQINALKAIMQDLGGGLSIVDGALKTAETSAGSAQKRLAELNSTISSSLIRSMNELSRASSNMGTAMIGGSMRSGIGAFTKAVGTIGDLSDPSQNKNNPFSNNAFQGALKSAGNLLAGPGLQAATMGIMKLLMMFGKFAYTAFGSLAATNSKLKDQAEIQKVLAGWLEKQPDLLKRLAEGHTTILDINRKLLEVVKDQAAAFAFTATASKNLTTAFVAHGGGISHAAGGYAPSAGDIIAESQGARAGGYVPGRIIATTVQDGARVVPIIANTAETKSRIISGGQVYETINPPENSYAGRLHKSRVPWAYGAGGFVSQDLAALPSVIEAINAEKSVVNAAIKIDRNPELVNTLNPKGLGVYNAKQMSLAHAIAQHKKYQSIGEIQSQRTTGHRLIPNLASDLGGGPFDSALMMSMLMGVTSHTTQQMGSPTWLEKLKLTSLKLADAEEQQAIKIRTSIREFSNLKNALLSGEKTSGQWAFYGETPKTYRSAKALQDAFPDIDYQTEELSRIEKKISERREATQNKAFKASIGAAIGGGIATQITEATLGSTAAEGMDKLTKGIMNAAQIIWAMPNKGGKLLGTGMAGYSAGEAIDTWAKGLATATTQFEQLQSRTQKVVAQLDSIAASLNNYDNLLGDSSVSYETLIKEQRKLTELMSQLKGGDKEARGAYFAIAGAGSNSARFAAIDAYKKTQSQNLESQASILALNKYASDRSFVAGWGSNIGWGNEAEKNQVRENISGTSASFIAEMNDSFKAKALKASGNAGEFQKLISGDKRMSSLLGQITSKGARNTVLEQMRFQLGEEASMNTPEGKAAIEKLQKTRAASQEELDLKIHYEAMQKRLFLNQGAYQANNNLDLQEFQTRKNYGEGMREIAQRQATGNLYKLKYGDRTNSIYSAETELRRGEIERNQKVEASRQGTARSVVGSLTQNFDSFLQNADAYKTTVPSGMTAPSISAQQFEIREALNKGIAAVMSGGTLERFSDKNGGLDYNKFAKEIVANSGSNKDVVNNTILKYLQNGNSDEILKTVQNGNKEILQINQDQLSQAQQTNENLKGMLEELKFKELSNFMGGMRSLLDRQSRRSMEREGVQGLSLAFGRGNLESRGFGAATYLKFLQGQGIAIDRKDPLVNSLWNIAKEGKMAVDYRSMNHLVGMTGRRFGGGSLPFAGALGYANKNSFGDRAEAAMLAEFKPENEGVLGKTSSASIDSSVTHLSKEVDIAAAALKSFGASIMGSKAAYEAATKATDATRKATSEINSKAQDEAKKALEKFSPNKVSNNLSDEAMGNLKSGGLGNRDWTAARGVTDTILGSVVTASLLHFIPKIFQRSPKLPSSRTSEWGEKGTAFYDEVIRKSSLNTRESRTTKQVPISATRPKSYKGLEESIQQAQQDKLKAELLEKQTDPSKKRPVPNSVFRENRPTGPVSDVFANDNTPIRMPDGKMRRRPRTPNQWNKLSKEYEEQARAKIAKQGPPILESQNTPFEDKAFLDKYAKTPEPPSKKFGSVLKGGGKLTGLLTIGSILGLSALTASASENSEGGAGGSAFTGSSLWNPFTKTMVGMIPGVGSFMGGQTAMDVHGKATDYFAGKAEKKWGYGAGLNVKYLMNAPFGYQGTAMNLLSDSLGIYGEGKEAMAERGRAEMKQRGSLGGEADLLLHGGGNIGAFYSRISNRINELQGYKLADEEGSKGVYGYLSSLISPKQFTSDAQKELSLLTQKQENLRNAIGSNDDNKIEQAIVEMKDALEGKDTKAGKSEATVNSKIDVKISLDKENITAELQDQLISPLVEQLANLERIVNTLKQNSNSTMPPARV